MFTYKLLIVRYGKPYSHICRYVLGMVTVIMYTLLCAGMLDNDHIQDAVF